MSKKKVIFAIPEFATFECAVEYGQYHDGTTAISLVDYETSEPIATATVWLEAWSPNSKNKNIVMIKEWSENVGITKALEDAGIVQEIGIHVEVNEFGSKAYAVKIIDDECPFLNPNV